MATARDRALASLRKELVRREERDLSPLAARSSEATRPLPEEPGTFRTDYLRDRGRVLYSKYFRKLLNKTQSFIDPFDATIHTRLMHSQEVAHIAKTVARSLRLNEDLAEAAALGHDLGHTPFGHAGEDALDACFGRFRHYEQSLRVVDLLDNDGRGLNLTAHVRDAIINHSKGRGPMVGGHSAPSTFEGWCVRWADPIAYLVHDIEDAVRMRELSEDDLPSEAIRVLGTDTRERLTTLTLDLILTNRHIATPDPDFTAEVRRAGAASVALHLSDEVSAAFEELRRYMYDAVYHSPRKAQAEQKVREVIDSLYGYFLDDPEEMPADFLAQGRQRGDPTERIVTDYVASLTDREAKKLYQAVSSARANQRVRAIAI